MGKHNSDAVHSVALGRNLYYERFHSADPYDAARFDRRNWMSVTGIHHVGIAVSAIDSYLTVFQEGLGMKLIGIEVVEEQGVRVALLEVGDSRIELLEPLSDESPVAKFLRNKDGKPGFHHIAFEVDDIFDTLEKAASSGVQRIDERPRRGAGNAEIAFLHPKSCAGVLTELCTHRTEPASADRTTRHMPSGTPDQTLNITAGENK
jgi:methylmalonyl-CoA/ethylmalonyl-CoA epimerase